MDLMHGLPKAPGIAGSETNLDRVYLLLKSSPSIGLLGTNIGAGDQRERMIEHNCPLDPLPKGLRPHGYRLPGRPIGSDQLLRQGVMDHRWLNMCIIGRRLKSLGLDWLLC